MPDCAGCGRPIRDAFIRALEREWHPLCFTCEGCGRPLGEHPFQSRGGKAYHPRCFQERFGVRCAACGQFISGQTTTALNQSWHPQCFTCGGCGKPIVHKTFPVKDGKAWHEICYHRRFSPPCAVCGKPLINKALTDIWGNAFCVAHRKKQPNCLSCGRIVSQATTGGGRQYSDGHTLCELCYKDAVLDPGEAAQLFESVRVRFEQMGFNFKGAPTPFRLVDDRELASFARKRKKNHPTLGMARNQVTTRGKVVVERTFVEVVILAGLPREHFETVAVHVLCHAWLFHGGFYGLPEKVEEGLCTLAEYLWLQKLNTDMARIRRKMIFESKDPIYGDGFRAALKALKKRNLAQLLTYIRKNRKFPGFFSF